MIVEGVYTYRVDDHGTTLTLRAFWAANATAFHAATT